MSEHEVHPDRMTKRQLDNAIHAFNKRSKWICFREIEKALPRHIGTAVAFAGNVGWIREDESGTRFVLEARERTEKFLQIFDSHPLHECEFFVRYAGTMQSLTGDRVFVLGYLADWCGDLVNQWGQTLTMPSIDAKYVRHELSARGY